jgi:hypothetical protein
LVKQGKRNKAYRALRISRVEALFVLIPRVLARYNQNALPENLIFELEHAVTFGDELQFGPLKILEYLHDKDYKMVVLCGMVERLLTHNG